MLIEESELLGLSVGRFHEICGGIRYFGKFFVGEILSGDQSHIVSTGIVLLVKESMRIRKVRIGTAETLGAAVHHIREFIKGSAHFLRKARCHFVGRCDHESVKTLLNSQRLAGIDPDAGTSEFDTENSSL